MFKMQSRCSGWFGKGQHCEVGEGRRKKREARELQIWRCETEEAPSFRVNNRETWQLGGERIRGAFDELNPVKAGGAGDGDGGEGGDGWWGSLAACSN